MKKYFKIIGRAIARFFKTWWEYSNEKPKTEEEKEEWFKSQQW